jgi:gliding motility-associated-like protein
VTASNNTTTKTYTVTITRAASPNANLANLKASSGALTPAFATATTSYTQSVSNAVTSVTLTPTVTQANATVKINGTSVASGTPSASLPLAVGPNTLTTVVTAQDGTTTKTYTITITRASGPVNIPDVAMQPNHQPADDGILVHQGVSPNGDGVNDVFIIEGLSKYPDNKLVIMNRNGSLVYEARGYDNQTKVFDGHSNKNGQMQLPGTYFYSLDYTTNGVTRHRTGFIVLKY